MARTRNTPAVREGRRPLIAGNWKMNLTVPEAEDLVRKLVGNLPSDLHQRVDVAVLPPFPLLGVVPASSSSRARSSPVSRLWRTEHTWHAPR